MKVPQKLGAMVPNGWCASARSGVLFVKRFQHDANAAYVDWGSTVETFTNHEMIELETLGPLVTLEPGNAVEHVEHWHLFRNVPTPRTEADVDKFVVPKLRKIGLSRGRKI